MIRIFSFLLALAILISCTSKPEKILNYEIKTVNGIENIINENIPSVSIDELNINLKKVLEINGTDSANTYFTQAKYFTVNSKGNIYIFDESDLKINKFDKNGKFLFKFGREGSGPGEFNAVMGICCLNDTLFAIDTPVKKMNRFDLNGKFINSSIMQGFFSLYNNIFSKNGLLWIQRLSFKRLENKAEMHKIVEARQSSLHRIAILDSSFIDYPPKDTKGELSISKAVAVYSSSIFIADKGDLNNYEIKEYDNSYKFKRVIKKKFYRLKVTDFEKKAVLDRYKLLNDPDMRDEDIAEIIKMHDYKPAIRWIFTDKFDRLWVEESRTLDSKDDNSLKFSIFKDGIYLNSVLLDLGTEGSWITYDVLSCGMIQFIGDYIYVLNQDENRITVYDY